MNEKEIEAINILTLVVDKQKKIPSNIPSLVREYCSGITRYYHRTEGIIRQLVKKPLKDRSVSLVLHLALYQIEVMGKTPATVTHQAVELIKKLRVTSAQKMINACLRRYLRERKTILNNLTPSEKDSFPVWLHSTLKKQHPQIQLSAEYKPFISIVLAPNVESNHYLHQLRKKNITAFQHPNHPKMIRVSPCSVPDLPGYSEGLFYIQDYGALKIADTLPIQAGDKVLDACAAPGGKSIWLAWKGASVECIDVSEKRTTMLLENIKRMKVEPTVQTKDILTTSWPLQCYDAILLDAPCSATGVYPKHPEVKLHRKKRDVDALSKTQLNMLSALWPTLKNGGYFLYATCSLLNEENIDVIESFKAKTNDAVIVPNVQQYLYPDSNQHGFFYCLLQKA